MTLKFMTAAVELSASPDQLRHVIETSLSQWGMPLRWAVTAVDEQLQIAHVEAIVVATHG